jgi:phosphoribosylformylglycinamidine cyclo-ligase|tara:strand:- start:367 stop:1518 length:1152 start_codon:yes stop_codon:yes gene_type:complete
VFDAVVMLRKAMSDTPLDYASSGVDIDAEGVAVASLVGALSASVRKNGEFGAPVPLPGGFGGIIEFGDYRLALATDGVGSKLMIANELQKYQSVGIDCVAMNVNDLLCVGAEPIAFVDYIAVPKTDPETHAILGASLAEACKRAKITLAGGETATLPGIVTELDLSGTALGWFPKGEAITGENLQEGDVLIGLPSSGIHSNGYTLVRAILQRSGNSLTEKAPFDTNHPNRIIERFEVGEVTLGEVLLNPTRIYVNPLIDLIKACRGGKGPCNLSDLKAMAHITGGGLSNLLRLHEKLGWHIDAPLPILPEFQWLSKNGSVNSKEMHRTFNMGMGMTIAVSQDVAESVESWLNERLSGCKRIGFVHNEGRKVTHVNPEIVFEHY